MSSPPADMAPPSHPHQVTTSLPDPTTSSPGETIEPPPALIPVDEHTSRFWYHGLPSAPRLLATTQTEALMAFREPRRFPSHKQLSCPTDHPMLGKWFSVVKAISPVLTTEQVE